MEDSNSKKTKRRWLRKVVLLALWILLLFVVVAVHQARVRPQKERELVAAQVTYQFTARLYRWTGRLFDLHEKHLGPSPWILQLARKIEASNSNAWDDLKAASRRAAVETVAVFHSTLEMEEVCAKLRVNQFGRTYAMKITHSLPDGTPTEWELQVPNQLAERAVSVLKEAQLASVATIDSDDNRTISQIINVLIEHGISASTILNQTTSERTATRDIVVSVKERDRAIGIIQSFDPTTYRFPVSVLLESEPSSGPEIPLVQ